MSQKLLLADDSVTIQRVIELTFADEDVQVVAVGDGRQAIDRIGAERPDIVLADIGMPGCDGYEVSAFVKNTPDLAHIPVLLLTGAFEPADEARVASCQCDGVLAKPFEPQQLIARVKALLGSRPEFARASAAGPGRVDSAMPAAIGSGPGVAEELGAAPPAESSRNTPAEDLDLLAPLPVRERSSLDDYFDRLDAAFANLATAPVPSGPPIPADPVGDLRLDDVPWGGLAKGDAGTGLVSAAARSLAEGEASGSVFAAVATPLGPAAGPQLFSALLDAEQGIGSPVGGGGFGAPLVARPAEDLVDRMAAAVVDRLGDSEVRAVVERTVREVAERLVREELTRLKAKIDAAR